MDPKDPKWIKFWKQYSKEDEQKFKELPELKKAIADDDLDKAQTIAAEAVYGAFKYSKYERFI